MTRPKRMAMCCPDKPYKARGLCSNCYARSHSRSLRTRAYRRWYKYGLTQVQYEELIQKQSGHCALCDETEGLEVDHIHGTKIVRGLLCDRHNRALGFFSDEELQEAVKYVEAFMEYKQ